MGSIGTCSAARQVGEQFGPDTAGEHWEMFADVWSTETPMKPAIAA